MLNKIKKSQVLRHAIQLIMFFALPGIYAMMFSQVKTVYKMIINGNFDLIHQVVPSLMEFVSVMIVTILIGRWFCGWICAFGAYNDLMYFISKKIFKGKFKVNQKVDSILKYTKYVILLFIIIVSWTFGSSILQSTSPWDVFGQITNISSIVSNLLIGLILLVLITTGAVFVERFFCRYLCPLGAIFAILSKIGIVKINKPKADCGKCRACATNCSMGLELYQLDCAKGGNCINCLKCTEVCPRKNVNINILGQDLNQSLAGSVAMAAMLGVYGITNFGVHALTKAGVISNNNEISSEALQKSASDSLSKKYKDGTYTGSGHGFGGTIKVSVTIKDGKIAYIKTLSNEDTIDYYNRAFETISKKIISNQTTQVDTVSGATYSSKGIISAVRDALNQAVVSSSDKHTSSDSNENKDENAISNSQENHQSLASEINTKSASPVNQGSSSSNSASASSKGTTSSNQYKDGTYTGSGQGFGGVTKVSVTVANGKITSVQTLSNEDTSEYYEKASNGIISRIISVQSANVDTVSGATFSSNGIISAVKDALSKEGGSNSSSSNSASNSVSSQRSISSSQYKNGTYTGIGQGYAGKTKVSVTIVDGKITSVKTISNEDLPNYYDRAIATITNSVISKQSASVDAVSGATDSSNGIIEAVKNALSQAKQ